MVLQENNAMRRDACDSSHMDGSPLLHQKWLFVNKGPIWRRWELVNLGGYKWIMRLSPTHSPELSVYRNQLLPFLSLPHRPSAQIQSAHLVLRRKPPSTWTPRSVLTLKCDSETLTKNSGHSVQIEILCWEAGSTMVKLGKFSLIGHRASFLTPHGNSARKFHANTWQVFLPNTHNLTWPRTRKHHMNPLEGHATEWLDCTLQKRPWKAKTSRKTVLD